MEENKFKMYLSEVTESAKKLLSPPDIVTQEERKLAEKQFIVLRHLGEPVPICKYILENGEIPLVQFEAVSSIIEHLIRKWVYVNLSSLEELLSYFMGFMLTQQKIESYVREQLVLAVSILIKRRLIDDIGENALWSSDTPITKPDNALLNQLCEKIESLITDANPHYNLIACSCIASLMVEFGSLAHSSRFGLSWEVHIRCKMIFERYYLLKFFILNLNFLKRLAENRNVGLDMQLRQDILGRSLNILNNIVTWSFTPTLSPNSMSLFKSGIHAIAFKPPGNWKDILLDGNLISLLYRMHEETRSIEQLCQLTLLCFIQLASLNGDVFESEINKSQYLKIFLENFLTFAGQVELTAQETAGFAGVISQMLSTFPVKLFASLDNNVIDAFLSGIAKMTIYCAIKATEEDLMGVEGSPYLEAFELLLLAWVTLLSEINEDILTTGWFTSIGPELFTSFLNFRLSTLSGGSRPVQDQNENQEIDELEEDDRDMFIEHLSSIATIARAIIDHSLPLVCSLLEKTGNTIIQHLGNGQTFPICLYEDFHWLLLLSGHMLVDITEGEEVQIPKEIRDYCLKLQDNAVSQTPWITLFEQIERGEIDTTKLDPLIRILGVICRWAKVETLLAGSGQLLKLSPQVASDIMWFYLHWSQPYLLYDPNDYSVISTTWDNLLSSTGSQSAWLLNFLCEKAISNIHQWVGEDKVQSDSLEFLTGVIRSQPRHKVLVEQKLFIDLVDQFGRGADLLNKLSPEVQLSLALFIGKTMAQDNWDDLQNKVIIKICERISKLAEMSDSANSVLEADSLLSALSGIARMCPSSRADGFLDIIFAALDQITEFLKLPEVISSLLSLMADIFESCLTYFSEQTQFKMYNLSLKIIELFSNLNKTISIQTHPHLEEDRYADLVQLMDILISLMSWDFLDLSDDNSVPSSTKVHAGDVVFYGLEVVLHFMAGQFLSYPSLCSKFFNLLTLICETYPERIGTLPDGTFHTLISLLEIGLFRYDADIGKYCLDAISSLALYGQQNATSLQERMLQQLKHLLCVIFNYLLDENFDMDLLTSAGESLFYLVLGNRAVYSDIVKNIIKKQEKCNLADRLSEIFNRLGPDVIPNSPTKKNVINFSTQLEKELPKLRGILCIK